ncbi:uncharacterized protein LOC112139942 isoform X2 [Oryzias melastigma]|uniref:uncharacterized protein LOC112139942 isoform X2 n=1 Tax=Oryzias melastigma TaxID=30732 RepID=UPI000CF8058D|nr:uncharacterized protein LOC112139942 isoform X2 [Oryzias melastigma]
MMEMRNSKELEPPGFSCSAFTKSVQFRDEFLNTTRLQFPHTDQSSTSSCVSMRSDFSKVDNPNFSAELGPPEPKGQRLPDRLQSSASSCQSIKSDFSKVDNPNFSSEPGPSGSKGQRLPDRLQSSASSCESMKSDFSKVDNPNFSSERVPSGSK